MWKNIEGYEDYQVSETGEVRSLKNGKIRLLKPNLDSLKRYYLVGLSKNGSVKVFLVHRLVAKTFIENPLGKKEVNHINCNQKDNRVCNLEWVTRSENIKHAIKNGIKSNPPTFKGKFGKEHNKSLGYVIKTPEGEEQTFYSGGEFKRKTGFDNTNLSNGSKNVPYTFKKGKLKGYTLVKVFKSYQSKIKES